MEAHLVPPHEGVIEMTDELLPVEGISRRDLLKRTAIVGGASALVWAAPSITTLGNRAFGATGTPPPDGWSFAAFIVGSPRLWRTIPSQAHKHRSGGAAVCPPRRPAAGAPLHP
jgi:hypothetical protein